MSCSAAPLICIPHFFYNADLLHKQAGTLSGKTGSGPRHAEILTRAASCDNVYRGKFGTIQFRDVPDMEYGGEPLSCHFDGEGFDLAGPHRLDAVADRREWEPSDSIEQAAQRGHYAIPMLCPGASLCSISAGRASCLISSSPICRMGMPQFIADFQHPVSQPQSNFPFCWLSVIQHLWVEQVDGDGRMPLMDGIPARLFRKRGVCLNISCIGRGDVNQFFSAHFAAPTACTTVRVVLTADCAA